MKTTLGGPPAARTALESSLRELEQKKTEVEAQKTQAEQRDVGAEAQQIADESRFKWRDFMPTRWKRLFQHRTTFDEALARLQTARQEDVERARAQLRTLSAVTEPFRALCAALPGMTSGVEVSTLHPISANRELDRRSAALQTISALETALAAAGECEATKQFPMGQLVAMKVALSGDVAALKAQLEPRQQAQVPGLASAVEQFIRRAEQERAQVPGPNEPIRSASAQVGPTPPVAPHLQRQVVPAVAQQVVPPVARPVVPPVVRQEVPPVARQEVPPVAARGPEEPKLVVQPPVVERPVVQPPVVERPVVQPPVVERPVVQAPVVERPVVQAPVVERPVAQVPVVEEKKAAPVRERTRVADKQGPLTHRGSPVEFGAEKETNMKSMSGGDKLAATSVRGFERALLPNITADMRVPAAAGKPAEQLGWDDLNDKGKAAYALAYSEKYTTDPKKPKWPVIQVVPNKDYSDLSFEPNGWIEVISSKFGTIKDAKVFLEKFGWGHIHTTWMRGAPPEEQARTTAWMRNANLWMFLDSLENRGASSNGETFWRFAIKGLSIPTEDHLALAGELLRGRNMTATAFSKHLHIGLRASGKYGHRDRIGFEARGGNEEQKKRVLDSLLAGLCEGQWGSNNEKLGDGGFKLVRVGSNAHQVNALPAEFKSLIEAHLAQHPTGNLAREDAQRLFQLVSGATFYSGPRTPNARLNSFDQRACTPLLNYEAIPWLSDEEKGRAVQARGKFIEALAALDARRGQMPSHELGQEVVNLIVNWAKDARLSGPFGRWLDGGDRQHFFS